MVYLGTLPILTEVVSLHCYSPWTSLLLRDMKGPAFATIILFACGNDYVNLHFYTPQMKVKEILLGNM